MPTTTLRRKIVHTLPLALLLAHAGAAHAQQPAGAAERARPAGELRRAEPKHQLSLDATVLGGTLAYAHRIAPDRLLGVAVGVGGNFLSSVPFAGRHFTDAWGISYESKDRADEELLFEMLALGVFLRRDLSPRLKIDYGLRTAWFLHFDDSDDDPGGGALGGAFASLFWGGRHLGIGGRATLAALTEGHGPELGIVVDPLILRLALPW